MKYIDKIIGSLILTGCVLILASSCKKDDNSTGNPTPTAQVPTITTSSISNILQTSAKSGGNITNDGGSAITARGVCWSTGQTPSITDNITSDGSGTGNYLSTITGLNPNTTYYVRAYATNSIGTGYGSTVSFTTQVGTVTDIEGSVYKTVTIGSQVWMAENLKTSSYSNGETIGTTVPATLNISGESSPKYQWAYDGNESNVAVYGRLYTWYTVSDSRGVCPSGWHVPSDAEWTTLADYLANNGYGFQGSGTDIGKSMADTSGWTISTSTGMVGNDQSSNNSSGFTALPSGARDYGGPFQYIGNDAFWWSSTESSLTSAWYRDMDYGNSGLGRGSYALNKYNGFSVRCVKD